MRTKWRLPAIASLAMTSTVHAQSTLTLYGLIDAGVTYTNSAQTGRASGHPTGASQFALTDGHATGVSGSRWGVRGVEDLGGGLRAVFVLENGFMVNSGSLAQGGAEFGRQSYVGLASDFGTLTLGRQYDPLVNFVQPFAASGTWAGYMGSHADDVDNLSNTSRINNAVKFTSATYHGFTMSAMVSAGGIAGHTGQNQIWSIAGGYTGAAFSFGMGYLNARDPNVSFYGNTPNKGSAVANNIGSAGSATTPQAYPVFAGYASAKTLQIAGAGMSWSYAGSAISVSATNTRFDGLGSSSGPNPLGYSGLAMFTSVDLNARYRATPALQFALGFDYTTRSSVKGDDGARYLQMSAAIDYSLSKATDLYVLAAGQRASGTDSLGQPAVASIAGVNPSATNKQIAFRLGAIHKF
ncbi:porin [Burkholderia contaminans]|uniref:porin n=1 Tax=Burkholderia contaminans TaxID=488447 RepID=UPI001CF23175|nr:porin [Burkholderia contaminans]MCA7888602.1 porin [Burkholderia contaminans]